MAEDDDVAYYQLVKDGGVHWNSVYSMIKCALKLRNAIDLYLMYWTKPSDAIAYDLSQDKLNDADWKALEQFYKLLHVFKKMTKNLKGNPDKEGFEGSYGSVWEVLKAFG